MGQHSIILINLFVNSEKIVNTIGCDYIFSCDNIIYDCYIYLYFTLKNGLKWVKYKIEFKEFSIGNFKGLANALDKLNCSYIIKQILFLKKIYSLCLLTTIFMELSSAVSTIHSIVSPGATSKNSAICFGKPTFNDFDLGFANPIFDLNLNMIILPYMCFL